MTKLQKRQLLLNKILRFYCKKYQYTNYNTFNVSGITFVQFNIGGTGK